MFKNKIHPNIILEFNYINQQSKKKILKNKYNEYLIFVFLRNQHFHTILILITLNFQKDSSSSSYFF
jgi:hypothetical protein